MIMTIGFKYATTYYEWTAACKAVANFIYKFVAALSSRGSANSKKFMTRNNHALRPYKNRQLMIQWRPTLIVLTDYNSV